MADATCALCRPLAKLRYVIWYSTFCAKGNFPLEEALRLRSRAADEPLAGCDCYNVAACLAAVGDFGDVLYCLGICITDTVGNCALIWPDGMCSSIPYTVTADSLELQLLDPGQIISYRNGRIRLRVLLESCCPPKFFCCV